ncbi:MAG: hypothetical protein RLZZ241_1866 [Bacteroidota bacterium]|jgi:beta-glucanase (GH16 family)
MLLYWIIISVFLGCQKTAEESGILKDLEGAATEIDFNDPGYWENATLVWHDEFDGNTLDLEKWSFEYGNHGWGNNEWQDYTDIGTTSVSDGTLKIKADKISEGQYTSARLNSRQAFTYGKIEVRAKIPENKGNGLWPAVWMLGSNIGTAGWPACGEIDLMEYVSYAPDQVHFSLHSTANNHKQGTQITSGPVNLQTAEEEFHIYGLLWTRDSLQFYLDSPDNIKLVFIRPLATSASNWPFNQSFYFLLNMAIGGDWGGLQGVEEGIFPSVFEIDYVRVYQVL